MAEDIELPTVEVSASGDPPRPDAQWPGTPVKRQQPSEGWPGKPVNPRGTATVDDPYDARKSKPLEPSALSDVAGKASGLVAGALNPVAGMVMSTMMAPREAKVNREGIDTGTGADFMLRVMLARSHNPREAKLMLDKYVGEGNYGQDRRGNWWVLQPGQDGTKRKVQIEPEGSLSSFLSGIGAGMASEATPMAGSAAGAAAGALTGPAAPFFMPLGAGVGYVGGSLLDEMVKGLQGTLDTSVSEEIKRLGPVAAINTAIPAAGPIAGKVGPLLKKNVFGVTPESSIMGQEVLAEGGRPPIGSVAPEATGFEAKRKLSTVVSGDQLEAANQAWLERQVIDAFQPLGLSDDEAKEIAKELARSANAVSSEAAVDSIVTAAQRRFDTLNESADNVLKGVKSRLDTLDLRLRSFSQPNSNLGTEIGAKMVADRRAFAHDMTQVANTVHQMAGGQAIIPVNDIKAAANQIIAIEPPSNVPGFVHNIAALEDDSLITIEQAHAFRNFARARERAMTQNGNLTPGSQYGQYSALEEAIDGAITDIAQTGKGLAPDVAGALKRFDTAYRDGIRDFRNLTVRKLARDIEDGVVVNPTVVADQILNPKNVQTARMVWSRLTPEMREEVRLADLKNLIDKSSYLDPETGRMTIDGMSLLKNLDLRREVMEVTHTPSQVANLREAAKAYGAAGGKLDPETMWPGALRDQLVQWKLARQKLDDFIKSDPLAAFRSGSSETRDAAAALLMKPGKMTQFEDIMAAMTPEERADIHQYALKQMFDEALSLSPSRKLEVSGNKIKDFLNRYTERQQDLILPYGMASSLRRLGDKINFMFPAESSAQQYAGGQTAQSVLSRGFLNPLGLHKRINWFVSTWLVERPAVLRWFADLAEKQPVAAETALSALGRYFINAANTGPGHGRAGKEQPRGMR